MYDDYKPSTEEWMDLLSIANTCGLKRLYHRAVAEIEDTDVTDEPASRVLLAKRLNIKKWLAPAYVALCTRTDPIKASEAEKLGIYTYVTLVAARESLYRDSFQSTVNLKDRALSVTQNLRCCGHIPSQLHNGVKGAKMCPSCQQIVIPGPGIQPSFTNDNRRCCNQPPYNWRVGIDSSRTCPSCSGIVVPAVVTANLNCCGYNPSRLTDGTNGAKKCPSCHQIVIPGPGGTDFTNNNRRCCNNPPSSWISHPDGSQLCPSCKGIVLPCSPLSDHERALAHVKRVFDLEDGDRSNVNTKECSTRRSSGADGSIVNTDEPSPTRSSDADKSIVNTDEPAPSDAVESIVDEPTPTRSDADGRKGKTRKRKIVFGWRKRWSRGSGSVNTFTASPWRVTSTSIISLYY